MNSRFIDVERFAYDIFRINWIKSKVPRSDIPFYQHKENKYPFDFTRSIAKYVMFYQVLIRNDLKEILEHMGVVDIDDDYSMFDFFNHFMKLNKDLFIYQVMQNVTCSLAICLELTLYKYPTHRRLLVRVAVTWKMYFRQYLQLDFFLNGGFEGLYKHAESMHANNYTLDKYVYKSNQVYINDGSNIWTTSHVPTFLKEHNIKIDSTIRCSNVSLLNQMSIDESLGFKKILCASEKLPVVGQLIKWTRKRFENIGSILLRRRSKRGGSTESIPYQRCKSDERSSDSFSESGSSESSDEVLESSTEATEKIISSMIENYMKSARGYYTEEIDQISFESKTF